MSMSCCYNSYHVDHYCHHNYHEYCHLDPPHLVLSWPIVQRWNRDKRKRRLGGESQVLQHLHYYFAFVFLFLDIIIFGNQICICICICHLQSGTQVGGKSGGHGREERERVARSQPGWGGWHA